MEELIALFNLISPLSAQLEEYLRSVMQTPTILKKKQILLREGDTSKNIYFIGKGLIRSYFTIDGMPKTMWIMKERDLVISVISFFCQKPSHETIEALEDCILWGISYEQLQYIFKAFPEFQVHRAVLLEKYYILSEERNYMRMQTVPYRYDYLLENEPELMNRVPRKYLASYLGIAEETFSRYRSRRARKRKNG